MGHNLPLVLGGIPEPLRGELLDEFEVIVDNYHQRKWLPSELSGGRFCEIVYTVLKGYQDGSYPSSASKPANFPQACRNLEQNTSVPHSMRILIPRVLPALYDIRNNRGVGHVGGDVDPNHMDAFYVLSAAKWVMAELIRVFHQVAVDEAQELVEQLLLREIPMIWALPSGKKRVLQPSMSMRDKALLLLYDASPNPMDANVLSDWVGYSTRAKFKANVLSKLHAEALVDYDAASGQVLISPTGSAYVETEVQLVIG